MHNSVSLNMKFLFARFLLIFFFQLSAELSSISLPRCPERKYWGVMDPEFVRRRWHELQQMVDEMIAIPSILKSATFQKFISAQ